MWVRGLKHFELHKQLRFAESHPMWVRGLKRHMILISKQLHQVAPYVGAWIETVSMHYTIVSFARRTLCGCVD